MVSISRIYLCLLRLHNTVDSCNNIDVAIPVDHHISVEFHRKWKPDRIRPRRPAREYSRFNDGVSRTPAAGQLRVYICGEMVFR